MSSWRVSKMARRKPSKGGRKKWNPSPEERAEWKAKKEEEVNQVLDTLTDFFSDPEKVKTIPESIAMEVFADQPDVGFHPQRSMGNKVIEWVMGTNLSMTFAQWRDNYNRYPKKGSKAIYLLRPDNNSFISKKNGWHTTDADGKTHPASDGDPGAKYGEYKAEIFYMRFRTFKAFRYEDTEGDDIPEDVWRKEKWNELKDLPLIKVAQKWGLRVKANGFNGKSLGSYSPSKQTIELMTGHPKTFLHELVHKADEKNRGSLKTGQHWDQEATAELGAQVLYQVFGDGEDDTTGNTYEYIQHYAKEGGFSVGKAIYKVMGRVQRALELVLDEAKTVEVQKAHPLPHETTDSNDSTAQAII